MPYDEYLPTEVQLINDHTNDYSGESKVITLNNEEGTLNIPTVNDTQEELRGELIETSPH